MYYTRYVRRPVRTPPVQKPATSEHETGNCGTVVREHKGGMAKKLVLDDADGGFWQRVSSHVGIRMPICKMLRRVCVGGSISSPALAQPRVRYGGVKLTGVCVRGGG